MLGAGHGLNMRYSQDTTARSRFINLTACTIFIMSFHSLSVKAVRQHTHACMLLCVRFLFTVKQQLCMISN